MTHPELNAQIRESLLESPHVGHVLAVRSLEQAGAWFVGIRVTMVGLQTPLDVMPVIALLRARIREILPAATIFIEPDVAGARSYDVSTEAIVIRGND